MLDAQLALLLEEAIQLVAEGCNGDNCARCYAWLVGG